ncbi:MAG: DUF4838 domain-containing protein [Planctomycetes bacterium]|nr:DUF4838 domain-containing protein [Planctomycetota bacterium]
MNRREWLKAFTGGLALGALGACVSREEPKQGGAAKTPEPTAEPLPPPPADVFFQTRGVVIYPDDFILADWPERARAAGLTTIALHDPAWPGTVVEFIQSDDGKKFLEKCRRLGLQVEYELHAMRQLLPRELFVKNAGLYRMDESGQRTADGNLCAHSVEALEIVASNVKLLAGLLKPTTGRYFFWGDDGVPGCRCPKCKELSDSDQALLLENFMLKTLRKDDPKAQVAHLAYARTYPAPGKIKPDPGVFLEFAPIERDRTVSLSSAAGAASADGGEARRHLEALDANLAVFGRDGAQVLEYWLDASLFSKWKRPAVKIPWNGEVFASDLDAYGARGLRHITTFAVYIDMDYVAQHGDPPLADYGARLLAWRPRKG